MGNLFAELKRRHIYRVAAAYAVVAWVLLQLVNNIAPVLDLPTWIARAMILLLAMGFPVALVLAWVLELKAADATPRAATGKLDWALIGALVVVIALVSYQQLAPATGSRTAQQGIVAPAPGGISIAVLPFTNMSGDTGQEFFSDGMTEEINGALAKVADLHVVARTSAFQFKGQNQDVRAVGQALGASHLIEGSVRKVGMRVRISAQLVRADNGLQLWSENYDRNLTDIFAIQEDIAQAIAASLRVPLGLKQGESLVRDRTKDLESYDQYLRAKALVRTRGLKGPTDAITILESTVARDSDFAAAWALLAQAYLLVPANLPEIRSGPIGPARDLVRTFLDKGEKAAREAVRLDPRNALGHAALARARAAAYAGWAEAEDLHKQALALDPGEPEALADYMNFLNAAGRLKAASEIGETLHALEPFVPAYAILRANNMQFHGQVAASISILEGLKPDVLGGTNRSSLLAQAYAAEGQYAKAADTLLLITGNAFARRSLEQAAALLRTAPAPAKDPASLPELEYGISFVYAHVGAFDRLLDSYDRAQQIGYSVGGNGGLWSPPYRPVRKTAHFKAYIRATGLVDYWKARGWPDLCRPMGADDFVCD